MPSEIIVTQTIRRLEDEGPGALGLKTTMASFISACNEHLQEPDQFEQKAITIKKQDKPLRPLDPTRLLVEGLSFTISEEDVAKITHQIIAITTDPLMVATLFKDLDKELEESLTQNNIKFTEQDLPQFLITGKGNYVPGPPPDHYHPKRKLRLLDELLISREQKNGINASGAAPKFVGFVDTPQADPFVAAGNIFTEDKQISRLLLHGSMSHRLLFDALCVAATKGQLNLKYGEGKELTPKQLLEMLVNVKYYQNFKDRILKRNESNLWSITIDNVADSTVSTPDEEYLNPDYYIFSCRSPFILNSLLLCFGKDLGLPHLQHYLLDSHWKAAYQMVHRIKESMTTQKLPDSRIYSYCMEALSTMSGHPGVVGDDLPFTLDAHAPLRAGYEPFSATAPDKVVKKINLPRARGDYASWDEFFAHQPSEKRKFDETQKTMTDSAALLMQLIKDKEEGKQVDRTLERDFLDPVFSQDKPIRIAGELFASLPPKSQIILLCYLGHERLVKFIGNSYRLNELITNLSVTAHPALITLLGSKFLQTLTKTTYWLVDMLCQLEPEPRLVYLKTLGKHFIASLFSVLPIFFDVIQRLQINNKTDAIHDLFMVLGHEPLLTILESQPDHEGQLTQYHRFEPWQGVYDLAAFTKYLSELEDLMSVGFYHILLISNNETTINLTYKPYTGWSVVNPQTAAPFALTEKNTAKVASKVFEALGPDTKLKISTQFCVQKFFLEPVLHIREKQQAMADQQVLTTLSMLSPEDTTKFSLLQQAFFANNQSLCEKLIAKGVDFYTCFATTTNEKADPQLFNTLCEVQAKFNIEKAKAEILSTDWKIIVGGETVEGVKVPKTVKLELDEMLDAANGKKTYYAAWENIIQLRKEAAKQNDDLFSFFRQTPAKEHYQSAKNENPILTLRKVG